MSKNTIKNRAKNAKRVAIRECTRLTRNYAKAVKRTKANPSKRNIARGFAACERMDCAKAAIGKAPIYMLKALADSPKPAPAKAAKPVAKTPAKPRKKAKRKVATPQVPMPGSAPMGFSPTLLDRPSATERIPARGIAKLARVQRFEDAARLTLADSQKRSGAIARARMTAERLIDGFDWSLAEAEIA